MTAEEDLQRLLHDAAGGIPTGNPPIGELIQQGRRSKAQRNRFHVAGAAAIVALMVLGGFFLRPHGTHRGYAVATPTSTAPTGFNVPPGMKLVGFHGVAVAVPNSWLHTGQACKAAGQRLVVTWHARFACGSGPVRRVPSLDAMSLESPFGRRWARNAHTSHLIGGVRYLTSPVTTVECTMLPGDACIFPGNAGVLVVPSRAVVMWVNAGQQEVKAVLNSVRIIPHGYTAVPDVSGMRSRQATETMRRAGLKFLWDRLVAGGSGRLTGTVGSTGSVAGSVVPVTTMVTRAEEAPNRVRRVARRCIVLRLKEVCRCRGPAQNRTTRS